jgi:hypothetical protein
MNEERRKRRVREREGMEECARRAKRIVVPASVCILEVSESAMERRCEE